MTKTSTQARVLSGVPAGGQFAAVARPEADVSLTPTVSVGFVDERLKAHNFRSHMTDEQVQAVTDRLNESRDFSDRNIEATANAVHLETSGYTVEDAVAAAEGLKTLRRLGRPEHADAIERVLAGNRGGTAVTTAPQTERVTGDGFSTPIAAENPRVQGGEVFDKVDVDGWGVFHRRREGVWADWPYAMRFQANRELTDEEKRHFAGLVGYAYASTVRGEPLGEPDSDSPYSFVVSADSTKTSSDDVGMAFERFEDQLPGIINEGSPIRKTDRAGAGTKGTRLVEGFNDPDLTFEVFYDSATSE